MNIVKLNSDAVNEFVQLLNIYKIVFESSSPIPDENYLSKVLSNSNFFVLVAKHNNEIIAGLTVFVLQVYYNEKPIAYIYDIGVKPSHQGIGIGKKLIAFLNDYCKKNGFLEAYVEAEADDTDAISFYRKTNFTNEMQATHFTYNFGN